MHQIGKKQSFQIAQFQDGEIYTKEFVLETENDTEESIYSDALFQKEINLKAKLFLKIQMLADEH